MKDESEGRGGGEPESEEREPGSGPLSVRDLMRRSAPAPQAEGEPRWEGDERVFEMEGAAWAVRATGAGSYGTGGLGAARLLAVHFFREEEPDVPVREALIPAGVFPGLADEELRALFERATPIDSLD